ncbi:hypothetical protein NEMBOFW57_004487 [Staphylotrichum longicolle]|uniref:Uncharacterized protein n=1 Tax=Staphylotrichum longicolle TaxID=669026 RepID=A0AAD4F6X4_9PEZI|nr:hypothetical protein NEMBOFW57_004487 [Staphylotrichum longicolle]
MSHFDCLLRLRLRGKSIYAPAAALIEVGVLAARVVLVVTRTVVWSAWREEDDDDGPEVASVSELEVSSASVEDEDASDEEEGEVAVVFEVSVGEEVV